MATPPTGRPRGRPPGAKTVVKRKPVNPAASIENIDEAITAALALVRPEVEPFKGGAVEFLMSVYKDREQPIGLRLDAAKAAAKYESPALQSVTMTTTDPLLAIEDLNELGRALDAQAASLGLATIHDAPGKRAAGGKSKSVRH